MPDIDMLKEIIDNSGMTKVSIAKKSGISRETLYNRLDGKGDFTVSEVHGLCEALKIDKKLRERIFFPR